MQTLKGNRIQTEGECYLQYVLEDPTPCKYLLYIYWKNKCIEEVVNFRCKIAFLEDFECALLKSPLLVIK